MKKIAATIYTLALLLTAGCSRNEVITTYEQVKLNSQEIPVVFDVYQGEQAQTRAINNDNDLRAAGFGVFAYYTQQNTNPDRDKGETFTGLYNSTTYPNFMYNQQVNWIAFPNPDPGDPTGYWKYTPLKYWPTDYGTGNMGGGATGSKVSGVSFFAYAPWVYADPATGVAKTQDGSGDYTINKTTGIVGFNTNTAYGDPKVHFVLGGTEDLIYAVPPMKNKNKSDGEQIFAFKHALAGITFKVGAFFDEGIGTDLADGNWVPSNKIADGTYITIESVQITAPSMPYGGWLNLNTGEWGDQTASTADNPATLPTLSGSDIAERLRYDGSIVAEENMNPGVGRKLDRSADDAGAIYDLAEGGLFVTTMPPVSGTMTLNITCNYHVWTFDSRNADGISKVENNVTNSVTFAPVAGKLYGVTIRLGMTSVKLDVKQYNANQSGSEFWSEDGSNKKTWNLPL